MATLIEQPFISSAVGSPAEAAVSLGRKPMVANRSVASILPEAWVAC